MLSFLAVTLLGSRANAAANDRSQPICDAAKILPGGLAESVTATAKPASAGVPAYCEVSAILVPAAGSRIGVIYRFPESWNGRLLGLGGGGMAGNVTLAVAAEPLRQGFATAQTDAGHASSSLWDSSWALLGDGRQNWPALEDFAYRAIHLMTVTGKTAVQNYYGKRPRHAYFQGCSTGGRQGLMEAQRFPEDYDGIISGAPAFDERVADSMVSSGRAFADPASKLDPAAIALVNAAVLRACDRLDGLADGIVTDPARCRWDPAELSCQLLSGSCLTDQQVLAVRRAYSAVQSPDGGTAAFGLPRGAELTAFPLFIEWGANVADRVGLRQWRGAQFEDPNFDFSQWDIGQEYFRIRTTPFAFMYDAVNPDLSAFIQRGGRLIVWHGLYDQLPRAPSTVDYVQKATAVTDALLMLHKTDRRAASGIRLFLLPGVSHCFGGPGADSFDGLAAIAAWVENGQAPDNLTAYRQAKELPVPQSAHDPLAPVLLSRPLCGYPKLPYYKGSGDPARAESFSCATAPMVQAAKASAIGSY